MDEILTTLETEVHIDVPMGETIEVEPTVKDLEAEVEAEITIENINSDVTEVIEIDMEESIGWSSGDGTNHHTLYGRDDPDQHIIESITGLREELDEIERLKPVCSDKFNIANYYRWKDAAYDDYGYFVSVVPGTSEIEICNGSDIFGVSIAPKSSGFIGGENATVPRDNTYGLIATSGLVDVRCESEINVGDYVVSNARGWAKKSGSNFGYRVLAIKDWDDGYYDRYAVISLNIQADRTNALGENLQRVKERVDANYANIANAVNIAHQAYSKVNDIEASNRTMSEQVNGALSTVDKVVSDVDNLSSQVSNAVLSSTQTQAIVNSAVTSAQSAALSAETAKKEAIQKAQDAIDDAIKLRGEFALVDEQITDIEDKVAIVTKQSNEHHTAIAGMRTQVNDESARIDDLVVWQGTANSAMARVEKKADANGAYIQSTVTNMDTHSVGPSSQAYGFTLEQATSFIEDGMIYVPTVNKTDDNAEKYPRVSKAIEYPENSADLDITQVYYLTDTDDTTYYYWGYDENAKKYDWLTADNLSNIYDSRSFLRGYLYKWGELPSGLRGWITVDKFYQDTDKTNTSAPSVFFTTTYVPTVASGDTWGYWYTDGDTLTGDAVDYQPKTLYKWAPYQRTDLDGNVVLDEDGNIVWGYDWCPVATLAGNSRTRAMSQIRQDANSIAFEVTSPRGSFAGMKAELTETSASVSSLADWKSGRDDGKAIIRQESNKDETKVVIAAITETDGELNDIASLELKVVKDEDGNPISKLQLSAEDIQFTSSADYGGISLKADQITLNGESIVVTDSSDKTTKISGDKIATGTITANKIAADAITAEKINVDELSAISANMGTVTAGTIQSHDYNNELSVVIWDNELNYTLNEDQTSYSVSGIGSYTGRNVVIPMTYRGLPITIIGSEAFKDCRVIDSVIIPDSVTTIGNHAFYGCVSLKIVKIGLGVTIIGESAFHLCSGLESIIMSNNITNIGDNVFFGCTSLMSVTIPNKVTSVGNQAFYNCNNLTNVTLGNSVTSIGNRTFFNCSSLVSITIPISVVNIDGYAFGGCYRLKNVYYTGTSEQWDEISIGSGDIYLGRATRYYYSETKPTVEGNFWHYSGNANGFRISCDDDYLIDSKHFKVTPDGVVSATNGVFEGNVYANNGVFNGTVYANDGVFDGTIYAREGQIGGYTLNNDVLMSGTNETKVILDASVNGEYAFSAGSEASGTAPFSVTKEGLMFASGGTFMGNLVAADCMIGPITFNTKSLNISQVTIMLSRFTSTSVRLQISARDYNYIAGRKGQMHYNYYNGSAWSTSNKDFTTNATTPLISNQYTLSLNNATKVIYTKPHIAWSFNEIQGKGINITTLLASGDWTEKSFESFNQGDTTADQNLWLHQGSAVIFADNDNNFISMCHFPLLKNYYGAASENIITTSDTSASIVCGGGTFNTNTHPGFYLGIDGFRLGNTTGSECTIHPDGSIWCKKLYVYTDKGYIDVGEKLKNL